MTGRSPPSLGGKLFRRVLVLIVLTGLVMAMIIFWAARQQIHHEADAELVTAANVLHALMQDEMREYHGRGRLLSVDDNLLSGEDLRSFEKSADRRMFAISDHGHIILRSDTGPELGALPGVPGFATVRRTEGTWRIYGLAVPGGVLIQVGERVTLRDAVLINIAKSLMLPLAVLIIGSGILLWVSLNDGLVNIHQLADVLARRSPRDAERLDGQDWPSDLRPLVNTLNDHFGRVEAAFWRERQFTDDAAHQLRTPLAVLKLQVRNLPLAASARERAALTEALSTAVDRASLLVSQMLTLARLDAGDVHEERLNVVEILWACMADQALIAARAHVEMAYEGEEVLMASTDATALRLIFSNLIENAVKYSGAGTTILVRAGAGNGDTAEIIIADQGPGIAEDRREAVLRRFHRDTGSGEGTGLGLAIVASALHLIGGRLSLEDAPGGKGLLARVIL